MSAINHIATQHEREVTAGRRFSFGRNWASFLKRLNQARIAEAENNLIEFLGEKSLAGRSFLDVGSGSGLSSLAARRLGATVTSFDYDGQSVACTEELRRRYLPDDPFWTIEQGSVLELGVSRGARPIRRRLLLGCPAPHGCDVAGDGQFKTDRKDRAGCCSSPSITTVANSAGRGWSENAGTTRCRKYFAHFTPIYVWMPQELRSLAGAIRSGELRTYFRELTSASSGRGMSWLHDVIDWVGGYPYEYASIGDIAEFYRRDGFEPVKIRENSSFGCHQLVFKRVR